MARGTKPLRGLFAINRSNFYSATIYPNGRFDIYRTFNGEWAKVPPTKSDSIKSGLGVTNEIMVTFTGNMAALYVNERKLFEFRGQPPQNGGSMGVFAASEQAAESEWRFVDITVVEND